LKDYWTIYALHPSNDPTVANKIDRLIKKVASGAFFILDGKYPKMNILGYFEIRVLDSWSLAFVRRVLEEEGFQIASETYHE